MPSFHRPLICAAVAAAAAIVEPAFAASKPGEIDAQAARVKALASQAHRPAYPDALMALARLRRAAGNRGGAREAAAAAAKAYDAQVELRKALFEALPDYDTVRAERAAARTLGLARDEAHFLVAELAREQGDEGAAVRHYVLVVQSQAAEPRGREAYEALRRMGWAAAPLAAPAATVKP